ncbi:Inner membrane protein [Pseudooceanicola batsensis HTCC2597]|uniref:Inner membrane protein n=1 Tax=Pseudooceanicola batsensis (strain ATCC BAA-863 / DSM 15984 / KCTC 12145 / HTCC2597) TaxID=252305 RepID=A3TV54_PSEBH|nr:MAPEG family protein [Pseudooceanicola batsensis]EAQ04400.1 Inner membrane protein [Pseudooceanicola batsensis HTCC2597]
MTPELTVLALAALLQILQIALYSVAGQAQAGTRAALKPRDKKIELSGRPGRIHRAMNNHFEGLILFTIAALLAAHAGSTGLTAACAWIYLAARILYVPAYVLGWVPWRSLIWLAGLLATTLMILASLL